MSIVPTLGPGGTDPWRRHGNTLLFARWLSTVFMTLEQLGEPHPCQAAGSPSWAWINPSSHIGRPQDSEPSTAASPASATPSSDSSAQHPQRLEAPSSSTSPSSNPASSASQPTSIHVGQASARADSAGGAPASDGQARPGSHGPDDAASSQSAAGDTRTDAEAAGMAEFVQYALKHARSQLDGSAEPPEPSSEALRSVDLDGPMLHGLPWREAGNPSSSADPLSARSQQQVIWPQPVDVICTLVFFYQDLFTAYVSSSSTYAFFGRQVFQMSW